MPRCPNCNQVMTSGDECRLYQALGYCFSCYPGDLMKLIFAENDEDYDDEKD